MSRKFLFNLTIQLANLYSTPGSWVSVVVQALDISISDIPTGGTSFDAWRTILAAIQDDPDSLIRLLKFVTSPNELGKKNLFMLNLLDNLQDGNQRQINILAQAIKQKQCVLFLGPGLLMCLDKGNLVPFDKAFSQELAAKLKQRSEPVFFDDTKKDQLSYIAQRYNEIPTFTPEDLGQRAKKFYSENQDDNFKIYERLAELYFPIIINTNPDKNLFQAIEKQRPNTCIYRYYSFENNQDVVNDTQPIMNSNDRSDTTNEENKTLFYNLLGSFDAPGSMILSESRLLKFMDKILREKPSIDKKIKAELDDQKYYLFLGFDIEQWYVKILFSTVLGINRQEGRGFSVFPQNMTVTPANQDFFEPRELVGIALGLISIILLIRFQS